MLGRHFYQFYKGPKDLFQIVIPFIQMGLENREACLWVVSSSVGLMEAVQALRQQFDLEPYLDSGQLLILPAEKWYLDRGKFSERRVLGKLEKFVEDKRHRGFPSYRGVGDLGWLEMGDWLNFQSYEEKIHKWLQDLQMTAVCAYPIHRCSLGQAQDILGRHDSVFLTKR